MTIQPGSLWRHSKSGNPYFVVAVAKLEATGEEHVVYMRVDNAIADPMLAGASIRAVRLGDFGDLAWGTTWIRPLREWEEEVSWFWVDGVEGSGCWRCAPRFVPLL